MSQVPSANMEGAGGSSVLQQDTRGIKSSLTSLLASSNGVHVYIQKSVREEPVTPTDWLDFHTLISVMQYKQLQNNCCSTGDVFLHVESIG